MLLGGDRWLQDLFAPVPELVGVEFSGPDLITVALDDVGGA